MAESNYALNRHAAESQRQANTNDTLHAEPLNLTLSRLNTQHAQVIKQTGYHIHPTLLSQLPSNPKIADVATGTGIWAEEVQTQLPDAAIHAWDISDAQFPAQGRLGVQYHLHDAREPFPEEWTGTFDLVHLQAVMLGLDQRGFEDVAKNVFDLLKPGGVVQWLEGDLSSWRVCRGVVPAHGVDGLERRMKGLERRMEGSEFGGEDKEEGEERADLGLEALGVLKVLCEEFYGRLAKKECDLEGAAELENTLDKIGFEDVDVDVVASDRVSGMREDWSMNVLDAAMDVLESDEKERDKVEWALAQG